MDIKMGISTCPNDTFIFMPMIKGMIDTKPFKFRAVLDDVETLNNMAIAAKLDLLKVSYGVIPDVKDKYYILKSGGALGFGCGPVLVSKKFSSTNQLKNARIAIPGKHTTAFRIFKHFFGSEFDFVELRFDKIIDAIENGRVDAGILIHEGRFVYENAGLNLLEDLGNLWEQKYSAPIPLGAILVSDNLIDYATELNNLIRQSITFSRENYNKVKPHIEKYAQHLDEDVLVKHIDFFVNEYSYDVTQYIDEIAAFIDADSSIFV